MKKVTIYILLSILCMIVPTSLLADIFITYTSGKCFVDLYGNNKWIQARPDLEIYETSIVKTGSDSLMEIEINDQSIAIGENTVVKISNVINSVKKRKKLGWFKKFSRLISKNETVDTALLGVRGAKSEKNEDIDWIGDETELEDSIDTLDRAIILYSNKKYIESIETLEKILKENPSTQKIDEVYFYLGLSYFEELKYDTASTYLKKFIKMNNPDNSLYEEALLKYSFSEYFLGNYKSAIDGFKKYSYLYNKKDTIPFILLMIGKSYKASGDMENAKLYFKRVIENYKNSEASIEASKELEI